MKGIIPKTEQIFKILREKELKNAQAGKRLEDLGKKISKAWKSKKTALELIRESRK